MEEKELLCLFGCVIIIALLVITWLLATNHELRLNCNEWESRTLNLESDLTQSRIKITLQDNKIVDLEQLRKEQLTNSIKLEEENQALRAEIFELESTYRQ
jgi:hypothetical protein